MTRTTRWLLLLFVVQLVLWGDAFHRAREVCAPGFVVDPSARVSNVSFPDWPALPTAVQYPDRVLEVEGERIVGPAGVPGARFYRVMTRHCRERPGAAVTVTLQNNGARRVVRVTPTPLSPGSLGFYFGIYGLIGLVALGVALAVAQLTTSRVAGDFALWGASAFALFSSFFGFHLAGPLRSVFAVSVLGFQYAQWRLALGAEPPAPGGRAVLGDLGRGAHLVAAGLLVLGPRWGLDPAPVQSLAGVGMILSSLALAVSLRLRRRREVGLRFDGMLRAVVGISFVTVGAGFLVSWYWGASSYHLVMPFSVLIVPLSIGYALVRHNILGATEVLTRRLLLVPNVAVSALLATLSWLALRSAFSSTAMDLALPTFLSGGLFVALVVLGHRGLVRWLFPASAHFRPTVQQIADRLATLDHHASLPLTLTESIRLWLPTDSVQLVTPEEAARMARVPGDAMLRLGRGAHVWTDDDPWRRHLLMPMRSLGALRGVLVLAPKHQGALYTSEDLALLETIASLGAVALHNAAILDELESLRRIEVEVVREDKRATLGLLGAELAHEISHPLQLFRGMLRRAGRGPLSETDLEVGGEEIERLERLLSNMRRLETSAPRQESVRLREPIERAQRLLADLATERQVTVTCEVPAKVTVLGDPDALVQIFSNLLRNAVQAAPRGGHAGVGVRLAPAVVIDVWDDGPGVPEHLVPTLFHRWVTNKEGGSGLGLAVARNLVVNLRWEIHYLREGDRTIFRLHARTDDRSTPPPRVRSPQPDPVDPS